MDHGPSASPSHLRAYLALGGGILCIGFTPIFVKLAAASGDVVGFYRLAIAALVMTIPVLRSAPSKLTQIPRKALGWALVGGFLFALDIGVWNTALNMTTASNATLLGNTAVLWVGLGAWLLFKEKLRAGYWLGLIIALLGVSVIVLTDSLHFGPDGVQVTGFSGGSLAALGNVLALSVSWVYAGYQMVTQIARRNIDTVTYMWLFSGMGAILLLAVSLILGSDLILPAASYRAILGMAFISHLGGWLLINYAFGHLRASLVSVSLLGQPVVTTIVALPILGEAPARLHLLGGIIALIGIATVHFNQARPESVDS